MSCCGKKRNDWLQTQKLLASNLKSEFQTSPIVSDQSSQSAILIRSDHDREISIRGVITGKIYRFAHNGGIVAVDRKDASAMLGIPHLTMIKSQHE